MVVSSLNPWFTMLKPYSHTFITFLPCSSSQNCNPFPSFAILSSLIHFRNLNFIFESIPPECTNKVVVVVSKFSFNLFSIFLQDKSILSFSKGCVIGLGIRSRSVFKIPVMSSIISLFPFYYLIMKLFSSHLVRKHLGNAYDIL